MTLFLCAIYLSLNIYKQQTDSVLYSVVGSHHMKHISITLIIIVGLLTNVLGQADSLSIIKQKVENIDNSESLQVETFDAVEVYGNNFDGDGVIKIYSDDTGIRKIFDEVGLSFGRITTVVYLEKGTPIMIIDKEENFPVKVDQSGLDYTQLKKVFEAKIYIFDWNNDLSKTVFEGERNLSEGTCSTFEYEGVIETALDLLKK